MFKFIYLFCLGRLSCLLNVMKRFVQSCSHELRLTDQMDFTSLYVSANSDERLAALCEMASAAAQDVNTSLLMCKRT